MQVVDDDNKTPNRVWLGADTPYKGPNKWFRGGRPRGCESSASQVTSGSAKMNQNIFFGIATPQLPVWATDSSNNPKSPKHEQCRNLKQWPECELPPHMTQASDIRRRVARRNQLDEGPPGNEGDDEKDGEGNPNSQSNWGQ